MNDYQSVRQGVREGARQTVVADYGSSTACGINGPAATVTGTGGTNAQKMICTTKQRAAIGDSLRVKVVYTPGCNSVSGAPSSGCPVGGTNDFGKVKVCATRQAQSITGLLTPFLKNVNLRSKIEMRAEKDLSSGATQLTSTEETDPSGAWSWC